MNAFHRHELSNSVNSADAESHHGTPETGSTALSPEDLQSSQCSTTQSTSQSNQPPIFTLGAVPAKGLLKGRAIEMKIASYQDPFVTISPDSVASRCKGPPKLSPIAPTFTPLGLVETTSGKIVPHTLTVPGDSTGSGCLHTPGSLPSASFAPEATYNQAPHKRYLASAANTARLSNSSQISPTYLRGPSTERPSPKSGRFSSDSAVSRSIMISQIDRNTLPADVESIVDPTKFRSLKGLVLDNLSLTGTFYVNFTDIRDAIESITALRRDCSNWVVQYNSLPLHGLHHHEACGTHVVEGQLLVQADFSGPPMYFDFGTVSRLILDMLNNYGDIMAYDAVIAVYPLVAYRVEFFDTRDAERAIIHLHGFRLAGCTIKVDRYRWQRPLITGQEDADLDSRCLQTGLEVKSPVWMTPKQRSPLSSPYALASPSSTGRLTPGVFRAREEGGESNYVMRSAVNGPLLSSCVSTYPDLSPQTSPWVTFDSASCGPGAIGQERHSPLSPSNPGHQIPRTLSRPGGRHVRAHSGVHHNVVDIDRIRKGADVRTTIMLRNIPNKIDQAMLKAIVDETSQGKYDFMYLRIDFANNCNVGYAFINFEDPFSIIEFVTARAGHRWNRFNSDKVAEVSYATIQGKDCLVQKFRNSSVMLEHPSFRPKIFRTGEDPVGGTEEPFPGPDNPSKMRRSVENAEHVGLFAPRAGQNFRDEQRRRRSQYDRGTRLAEMEDSYRISQRFHGSHHGFVYQAPPHPHGFRYLGQHAY